MAQRNTQKRSTGRSLLLSVLSLTLCIAMLLGTTYAWFTDEVKSGVNTIQAGNLDIELYHQSKNVAKTKVDESTKNLFKDVELWEPGAFAYETFTIANEGTLALKFKMALNVISFTSHNGRNLTEVIKVATTNTAPATREEAAALSYTALEEWNLADYSSNNALAPNAEKTFTVVLYWEPTNHDNDYNMNNGKPYPLTIDLGITLLATQQTAETDSFDDQYDKDADTELPEPTKYESKLEEASSPKTTVPAVGETVLTAAATPTTSTAEDRQDTTVTFPKGTLEAGKDAVLNVKTTNTLFEVTAAGAKVASIDLKLTVDGNPVTNFGDEDVTVVTYISAGLTEVNVAYVGEGDAPTNIEYVFATGKLTFTTNHFSEFTASGKAIAYILGEKDTGFEGYAAAAEAAKQDGAQVELTVDADMEKAAQAAEEKGISFVIPTQVVQEIEKGGEEDKKVQSNFSARVGTKYFGSVADAMEAAGDGDTVIVLNDCNIVGKYDKKIGEEGYSEAKGANRAIIGTNGAKNLTLNLNGNTITGRLNFVHGNLTVKNGKWVSSSQAINIFGSKNYEDRNTNYTVVTVEKDVEIVSVGKESYGIAVFGGDPDWTYWPLGFGEVVNFYGKVTAPIGIANVGNIGMDTYSANIGNQPSIEALVADSDCNSVSELMIKYGPVLNIYDGAVVDATAQAIYWPGLGKINIMGGSITGTEAIGIKGGIVNISGGTLTANGPRCNPVEAVNSGEERTGAAISITTTYNANYPITVNVTGGKLESKNNVALLVAHAEKKNDHTPIKAVQGINLSVSGGTFVGASELGGVYVEPAIEGEEGKYPTKFITGGTFDKDPSAYVVPDYAAQQSENAWIVVYDPYVFDHLEDIDEANGTVTVVKKSFKNPSTEPEIKLLNQPLYVVTKEAASGNYDTLVLSFKNEVVNGKNSLQAVFGAGSLPSGAVVLIKEGTYTLNEAIIDFWGDVIFTGEEGKAESTVLKVYENYMMAQNKAYKIFRLNNRVKGAPVSNYAFANMTIQSYNDTDNNDNALFATCYNIKCDLKNVTFKNYKGYCVGAWANDTYNDGTYPSKEDNLGVVYFLDNVAFDNCGTAFYFDTAPYTSDTFERFGFIHFWYKNTEIPGGMTMYRYASDCDDTAGNWMINGELYNKAGKVVG